MTQPRQDEDFVRDTGPVQAELLAYCYRMLGSVHDAEDLVQETLMRAWQGYGAFEGRASMRTWLYRIATNVCLRALERRERRDLPIGLGGPDPDPTRALDPELPGHAWLQPIPDALLGQPPAGPADLAGDPAAVATARESMRLALTAAFQFLPPRQRAVLILRDVLAWRAAEVAALLDTSEAAVNSTLQRARARLAEASPVAEQVVRPAEADQRALLDRYTRAFETADIDALMGLLTEDAVWQMPPVPNWFRGRAEIGRLVLRHCPGFRRGWRFVPLRANGQPAFGVYMADADGVLQAHAIHVLDLVDGPHGPAVAQVVAFHDPDLFPTFGLPVVPGKVLVP
ncbi:sigma-70 family RNA polymerase sigma factor [Yinghuangia sp. KLBMP8922]|uniref:RNA polymerase sigma factor n=2 Tax=Yinghuangia soli TaxID=2908204 RepID=A0AA41PYD2_9ACTN|nr:sigma-70 family RNA polymerase sigma factor [Yinghuangia soli]